MRIIVLAGYAPSLLDFRGPLLKAFQRVGLEVHVAAPGLSGEDDVSIRLANMGILCHHVPIRRTSMNPIFDLWSLWRLRSLFRQVKPNIILGYTIKPVVYGTLAAWWAGVERRFCLITGLGYAFANGDSGGRLIAGAGARLLYRLALTKAHKVFFQNPDDEHLFRKDNLLHSSAASVVVHGSGVDLDHFTYSPLSVERVRFLLIARLLGDKGIREYVEAARSIRNIHRNVVFSLVGWIDGSPDSISQDELDCWKAEGVIHYLGKLDDVRDAIAAHDVYVLPSYREGTPRSVLEAMAMGRAIITTEAPGCRETVVDGENGFLVPVRNAKKLAEAMLKFVHDPTLSRRMGLRSRVIAEDKYDVHKVNAVMLKEMDLT